MSFDMNTITRRSGGPVGEAQVAGAPRLVAAFECRRPLCPGLRLSLDQMDEVLIGRGTRREWARSNRQLVVSIPDPEMSRLHVRIVRAEDGWSLEDVGSKNGTMVDGVRIARCALADGYLVEMGGTLFVYRDRAERDGDPGDRDLGAEAAVPEVFRTLSPELERRAAEVTRIAPTPVSVLVLGETGTGKELVAEAIHAMSGRRGPFVPVNCGALPRTLIESELFGHRRGAFSGALEDRAGLARKADGGTLFLDEVAELSEESQVALLRLLQEGEVRPIGSTDFVRVSVRVIAATHQDLEGRIADGRFRRDLYARLAGYEMMMPPLRERPEDIGSIIATLLLRFGATDQDEGLCFQPKAAFALFSYPYPMNVRELEQALRAAVALASRGEICLEHLPPAIRARARPVPRRLAPEDAALRARLVELLRQNDGNIMATSRALEKAPVQIRRWCRRFGIDLTEFRRD
jgi:transcriptional regulator with GAF, ATPase, and Fis domain